MSDCGCRPPTTAEQLNAYVRQRAYQGLGDIVDTAVASSASTTTQLFHSVKAGVLVGISVYVATRLMEWAFPRKAAH